MKLRRPPERTRSLLLFILVGGLVIFACGAPGTSGSAPPPQSVEESPGEPIQVDATYMPATPTLAAIQPEPTQVAVQPAVLEARRLTLEFPPRMRAGVEGEVVRLTLEVDELGNITPTAQFEETIVTGETILIPDIYETHKVTAEARLDLAGMAVSPAESVFEPLTRGQSVTFYWSITPSQPGRYRGITWLHLNFTDRSSGEHSRAAVSAQILEIEAVDFFGLSVSLVRTSGVIGSVVGGVLGFPFIEDILKFLFKRRKK